jgi:hypothetical protein
MFNVLNMGVYDFLRGTCPYCNGQIDTDENGTQCGSIQTKICSDGFKSFRTFRPGDRLPLLHGENYHGNIVPKTFWWIPKENTVCCNQPIIVLVTDRRVGRLQPASELPKEPTCPVYRETIGF